LKKDPIVTDTATLYCGDCNDILGSIGHVDAIITDPPYGISADKKNAHSSIRDNSQWEKKDWDKLPEKSTFDALLTMADKIAIWGGNYFSHYLPPSPCWLVWRKPESETGFSLADAELCWTNTNGAVRMKTFLRRDGNEHPTQKPVSLMSWCLSILKVPAGGVVLDPFMGSGTTGVSCMQNGFRFIGIEKDRGYFLIAKKRILEAQAQLALFQQPISYSPAVQLSILDK